MYKNGEGGSVACTTKMSFNFIADISCGKAIPFSSERLISPRHFPSSWPRLRLLLFYFISVLFSFLPTSVLSLFVLLLSLYCWVLSWGQYNYGIPPYRLLMKGFAYGLFLVDGFWCLWCVYAMLYTRSPGIIILGNL